MASVELRIKAGVLRACHTTKRVASWSACRSKTYGAKESNVLCKCNHEFRVAKKDTRCRKKDRRVVQPLLPSK